MEQVAGFALLTGAFYLPKPNVDLLEGISWCLCTCILFCYYNSVGELAATRGVEYSTYVDGWTAEWDQQIPVIPHFVFPYIAVYAEPILALVVMWNYVENPIGTIRRFYFTQIALIFAAFACYYAFPVRTDLLTDPTTGELNIGGEGWLYELNYRFVHQGISLYVACPSMHNAHAFSIAAAFNALNLPGKTLMKIMAVLTVFSTIFTKGHPPPHVPLGALLGLLMHYKLFVTMEQNRTMETTKRIPAFMRILALTICPVVFFAVGQYLEEVSGWHTDIPKMLGFEFTESYVGVYGF